MCFEPHGRRPRLHADAVPAAPARPPRLGEAPFGFCVSTPWWKLRRTRCATKGLPPRRYDASSSGARGGLSTRGAMARAAASGLREGGRNIPKERTGPVPVVNGPRGICHGFKRGSRGPFRGGDSDPEESSASSPSPPTGGSDARQTGHSIFRSIHCDKQISWNKWSQGVTM